MTKDYYQILGVAKSASSEEIKRAYRKLAHQYHPDKDGGDEAKFKEVNEAYQILSNPGKRQQYDTFSRGAGPGSAWGPADGFSSGFNFGDIFSRGAGPGSAWGNKGFSFSFGGLGDIFEDLMGQTFSQVQAEVRIKLSQALLGDTIQLKTSQGEEIILKIPAGTQDNTTFRFRGKGGQHRRGRGDLLINVRINFPRRLSRRQRKILEELKQTGL